MDKIIDSRNINVYSNNGQEIQFKSVYTIITTWSKEGEKFGAKNHYIQ